MGQRTVLVMAHTGRENALRSARLVAERLTAAGVVVRTLAGEFTSPGAEEVPAGPDAAEGAELVIVLGGDGSLLRAAEFSRPAGVPLIGVNLGHVGFLAEAEPDGLPDTVDRLVAREYTVEERMTIDVDVCSDGSKVASAWALNEATVEKAARERMIEVITEVDGRPLSRWGCDGVVCSTPTARPRTRSPPADPWCGPRWRRCSWCRSARTRCSPRRWWCRRDRCSRWS